MKERPILFSGAMVRAILEGRKSQTRRVCKPVRGFERHDILEYGLPHAADPWNVWWHSGQTDRLGCMQTCPYGVPGDRLWVRETLQYGARNNPEPRNNHVWRYAADNALVMVQEANHAEMLVWATHKEGDVCTSIHMPRWASRMTLEIAKVRVERLQDISEADAIAEGCQPNVVTKQDVDNFAISDASPIEKALSKALGPGQFTARFEYQRLWDSINAKRGFDWNSNPWAWALEFRAIEGGPRS